VLVDDAICRHGSVEDIKAWIETWDTEQFWLDVHLLYSESLLNGNEDAFRALLMIDIHSDGAVGEGMPAITRVIEIWPEMSGRVISADDRFLDHYGRFLRK